MLVLPKEYLEEIKLMIGEDELKKYLSSLNLPINSGIVINRNKINEELLYEILNDNKFIEKYKNKYYTYKKNNDLSIGKKIYHHMGLIYVQEPSSYEVINNLDIKENFNFIDLCASPGGKSIDTLLKQDKGIGILNEIDLKRCNTLKSNIERLGFTNTIITNNKPSDFIDIYENFFDLVLVDAPCSGEGMFKKSDIAINNWSIDYVKHISNVQKEIIDSAIKLVNDNGYLVYSTCTYSKYEDEDNTEYIISKYNDFKLIIKDKIFPHNSDGEGQYYSIFRRENKNKNGINVKTNKTLNINNKLKNEKIDILNKYFINYDILKSNIIINKIKEKILVYYLKDDLYNEYNRLSKLNIKYKGLLLGEIDKNGFIPSNELAHSYIIKDFKYKIEIDEDNANRYLKGELIQINENITKLNTSFDFSIKEYVILTYKRVGIGIGKIVDNKIKNLYPKGLRNL